MRRIIPAVLMLALAFGSISVAYGAEYNDVKSTNWAYESVKAMSEKQVIKGYPDGSFKPGNTVTYAEFIKMVVVAATGEELGIASKPKHWAQKYYDKAVALEYFNEHQIKSHQLGLEIPRGDMALIISSILGDIKIESYSEIQQRIGDVTHATKHEYDITKTYYVGVLTGYTDKTFKPEQTLSRAESASVIHRLVDESKRVAIGEKEEQAPKVTYKTSELLDMKKLTPDKTKALSVKFTEEYELYTDAGVWDMKMFKGWNGSSCSFDHTLVGHIYLIKDGKIVDYSNTGPRYDSEGNYLYYQRSIAHYDVKDVDYIISVPSEKHNQDTGELIKVVVNPFKK